MSGKKLGLCVFKYGQDLTKYDLTLEDVLGQIADHLRGWSWNPEQWTDLVVVGETGEHYYVLNEASESAMDKLAEEYGGQRVKMQNVSKTRLHRVTVRNMTIAGRDSIILEAFVHFAESAHGYCTLFPTYLNVSLHELYDLMNLLMSMKMLKLSRSKNAKWIRDAYDRQFKTYVPDEE